MVGIRLLSYIYIYIYMRDIAVMIKIHGILLFLLYLLIFQDRISIIKLIAVHIK